MADFNSKYTGEQVEEMLDQIASGEIGGGGITVETDPVFSASPAASITEEKKTEWDGKYTKPSGGIPASDLASDVFLQGEKGDKGDKGDQGEQGIQGEQGPKGDDGVGIASVVQTTISSADGGSNVVTVTLSDGKTSTFTVKNGSKGSQGEKGDKGDIGPQGNSGYQGVVGELEVVNNFTQGGEASALSAEQGKILDGKLTELSEETNLRFKESSESTKEQVASLENKANKKFASVDSEIENLKRGEAYVMGDRLMFRNYADAQIFGNTLKL